MPTVPSADTAMDGVKAWTPAGDWFTLMGVDHLCPPSVDFEKATSAWPSAEKRPSSQVTKMVPLFGSTARLGRPLPVRTGFRLSGSIVSSGDQFAISIGCDHVSPASRETMTASVAWVGDGCTPDP